MTTVIFLPFAGAGASVFRPWAERAGGRFTVFTVQLPGREERFAEEPLTMVPDAVEDALAQVLHGVPAGSRIALFGHSLGAVLAFELALRLESERAYEVVRLFASGSPGPTCGRVDRASGLDDEAFLAQVRRFAGYDHPALAVPEMRDLLLPTLRADVAMHETYVPSGHRRLAAPVTCLRGSQDELVSPAEAERWLEATAAGCDRREIDGGHMYLTESVATVTDIIAIDLGLEAAR